MRLTHSTCCISTSFPCMHACMDEEAVAGWLAGWLACARLGGKVVSPSLCKLIIIVIMSDARSSDCLLLVVACGAVGKMPRLLLSSSRLHTMHTRHWL